MKVQGKVFAVTGGGNGIGQQTVLQLLAKGASVAAIDLSSEGLAETERLAGSNADRLSTHIANLTDRDTVALLPKQIIERHGQVDGLLNVAGIIQKFVHVNELEYADIERVIDVNLYGVINTVKEFLPVLMSRPEATLLNVSSMGSYTPVPGQSIYGATKAAVRALTDGLHSELKGTGVHVTTVFPGAIGTNIMSNSGLGGEMDEAAKADASASSGVKMTSAEEAGRVMVEAVEKNKYHAFIGKDARMMNLMSRIAPKKTAALIYKQMSSLLN